MCVCGGGGGGGGIGTCTYVWIIYIQLVYVEQTCITIHYIIENSLQRDTII